MPYHLAPGVSFALVGDQAIMLDIETDRYSKLSKPLSRALIACLSDANPPVNMGAIRRLLELGLISASSLPAPPAPSVPCLAGASIVPDDGCCARLGIRTVAYALAASRSELRLLGLSATLARARTRAVACKTTNPDRATEIARAFRAKRGWLPFSRACLPDSLALHAVTCRHGVKTSLVIGVRDHPFAAHCWIQADELVLTDELESIQALTPILWL